MTYNRELCKQIDVVAVAPGGYISSHLCRSVVHYVSKRDIVPWLDIKGRFANKETVRVLEPHKEAKLMDHDFQSPTYHDAIQHHIDLHLENNRCK